MQLASLIGFIFLFKIKQEDGSISPEGALTGVPHKDTLLPFIEALIDVIRFPQSSFNIVFHSLKVILRLLEHNYGFFYVKRCQLCTLCF